LYGSTAGQNGAGPACPQLRDQACARRDNFCGPEIEVSATDCLTGQQDVFLRYHAAAGTHIGPTTLAANIPSGSSFTEPLDPSAASIYAEAAWLDFLASQQCRQSWCKPSDSGCFGKTAGRFGKTAGRNGGGCFDPRSCRFHLSVARSESHQDHGQGDSNRNTAPKQPRRAERLCKS